MRQRTSIRSVLSLFVLAAAFGAPARPQEPPPSSAGVPATRSEPATEPEAETVSEEITVTARQVGEALEDVPATVTVITDGQIEAVGVQRAESFIKLAPGVSMINAAEVGDTQVNIRGINGSRDAENSFAFILDGILMTNPAAFNREFADLQQIEVLKGPQGAIYGRNAAAGAMIVTTTPPGDRVASEVRLSLAEDSTYFAGVTIGGPLGASAHRFQVHGDWRTTDGFYTNDFLHQDDVVDDFESYNLSGRLVLDGGERTKWDLKARYGEVEAAAITFNANFSLPSFAAVLGVPEFDEDVNDHQFVFQPNIDPRNDQEALELSAKMDHELDRARLSAWLLYSDIRNSFFADGTSGAFGFFNSEPTCIASTGELFAAGVKLPPPQILGPVPAFSIFGPYTPTTCDGTQYQVRNQEDLSFEARLTSKPDRRLRWQTGVYYLDIEREVGVNLGIDRGLGVVERLFVPQDGANPTEQLVHDRFDTRVLAAFGSLFYDLTDDVELSLAARYDSEKREVRNLVPTDARTQYVDFTLDGVYSGGAPLNPGLDPSINPSGVIAPKSETFDELQPRLSTTWDLSDRTTFFGSWGVGFKSGGFNNQGSNATANLFFNTLLGTDLLIEDQFDKETSSAFELGFKTHPTPRFYLEGALYRTEVDDMQFFEFLVGPFGLLRVVSNIDDVLIEGAEIGWRWRVGDHVSAYGGGAITESEIRKNSSRPATVGNESPATPAYTAHAGVEYSRPIGARWVFLGSANWNRVGPTWFHTVQDESRVSLFNALFPGLGVANYSKTRRDAYDLVDLRIGVSNAHWRLTLFSSNLTDEVFLEEVITAPEFGGEFIHPGSRRRLGLELAYRF